MKHPNHVPPNNSIPLKSKNTRQRATIEADGIGASVETTTDPTFEHESRLAPPKWQRITENGVEIPGWVQHNNLVNAMDGEDIIRTYCISERPTPTLHGFSWNNLDVCDGWRRDWRLNGTKVSEHEVILRRVLAGQKVCGAFLARRDEDETHFSVLDLDVVRDAVSKLPQFELVETPFLDPDGQVRRLGDGRMVPDVVWCWVAPRKTLAEVVPIDDVADWYDSIDKPTAARTVRAARDFYLPDLANRYDVGQKNGTRSYAVTGLALGFPLASTAEFWLW
ncbi:MAG: hypothetical protein ACYDEH_12050 [Acidimicrobiales bacterium]